MGLLIGESNEVMDYSDTKKLQKKLKYIAAWQLSILLTKYECFTKSEEEMYKYGTELEAHMLTKNKEEGSTLKYSVYTKHKHFFDKLSVPSLPIEIHIEFASWMVEFLPLMPFNDFLNVNELNKHYNDLNTFSGSLDDPIILNGLSVLPIVGIEGYYRINDKVIPINEVEGNNKFSHSKSFLDEGISPHS